MKEDKEEYNWTKDILVDDIIAVVNKKFGTDSPPPMLLVGHSLGGALAIHCANKAISQKLLPSLQGIVVIDVVEGTALDSLQHMPLIIDGRPKQFTHLWECIHYCVSSGMIRNHLSARLSVPPMFRWDEQLRVFKWRTDIMKSKPFWEDWFVGMSDLFLTIPCAKLLMLAGPLFLCVYTDRLDKPLMIGQMQGKYELAVMGLGVGHAVHEDTPHKVAEKLSTFIVRNKFEKMWELNKKLKLKTKT
ncbi:hypothetical protein RFI_23093 [Reticulomyxa filosa]|uniref:protein phosphatase methylesterase-1 n=1 Tax=Reticulomyxa filosa TaxID=46433 RepID=X6MMG7_RETFI|nr:hypothetical protein RFI_23093 [Reticulomyxa filosa]|eukprot:ETO14275.1 hypothetical protein RFI_23093 [Reticulomyxa filosa]